MLSEQQRILRDFALANARPFMSNPEAYTSSQRGMCGSMKRYFSIRITYTGVVIFTYDDSDDFQPVMIKHSFDHKDLRFSEWSPLGSSLLCFTENELMVLHIEPSIKEINFFVDGKIYFAEFSPQENFITLQHELSQEKCEMTSQHMLEVRDAKTGKIRKKFIAGVTEEFYSLKNYLKFNYDDNFLAVVLSNSVCIYETKTFSRVKHLMFKQVQSFSWSPSSSLLALFCDSNRKVVDICSGKVMYGTAWEGVDDCKIMWESSGDYLVCMCIGIDYKKIFLLSLKSGKTEFISPRQDYIDFAWRGNGKEFAVTRGPTKNGSTIVNFYTIQEDGKYLRHRLHTVQGLNAYYLHWSPNGRFLVMQGSQRGLGELYFYDVDNHQPLASTHFIAINLEWDSSSRFFLTQATVRNKLDQVLRIWSSHGEKLIDVGPCYLQMRWKNKLSYVDGNSMDVDSTKNSSC